MSNTDNFSPDTILKKIKDEIENLVAESPDGKVSAEDVRNLKDTLDSYMFPYIRDSIKQSLDSVSEFEEALNMLSDNEGKPLVEGSSLFDLVKLYNGVCSDAISFEIIMTDKENKDENNTQLVADILWHYLSLYSRLVTDVVISGAYKSIMLSNNTEETAEQIRQTIDDSLKEMCFTLAPNVMYNLCKRRYNKLANVHNAHLNTDEEPTMGCQLKLFDMDDEDIYSKHMENKIVVKGNKTLQ
ncbi:MAG: hypothetical protein D6711_03340 [Chloroflexi bacterium]|nr:MAG: hypothetical protein D6711_03340 [Chloroflexota bacterium]